MVQNNKQLFTIKIFYPLNQTHIWTHSYPAIRDSMCSTGAVYEHRFYESGDIRFLNIYNIQQYNTYCFGNETQFYTNIIDE